MDEAGRRELETLKKMVLTWKNSYLQWAPSDGEGDFLVDDFVGEIEEYMYPYLRRLCVCNYITEQDLKEFMEFCYGQAQELSDMLNVGHKNHKKYEKEGSHA